MQTIRSTIIGAVITVCVMSAAGQAPAFKTKPAAVKAGDSVKITFAADRETDVAVSILDAKGKCVRHLAAGVLGGNAPAPLQKNSLTQSLSWDGKDDAGRAAPAGPLEIRVALGLKPTLDRMIGHNPAALGEVRGLAVGPDGTVYVFSTVSGFGSGASHGRVLAFDRNGKYLREVVPYPADLPEEGLKGLKRVEITPGVKVPFVYNAETRGLFPGLGGEHGMFHGAVTRDGRLFLCGIMEICRDSAHKAAQVLMAHTDGSAPESVLGPVLCRDTRDPASFALSPDEKTVYATGMRDGIYTDKNKFIGVVYSFSWGDKDVKPLVTAGLNEPHSIAVDGAGNLYVSDTGNNRIAVFQPDGSFLGELKVDQPERVEVNRKTGALYVLGGAGVNELQKFASWKDAGAAAKTVLPSFKHKYYTAAIAVDDSAEPPVIWVGSMMGQYAGFGLLRIEDKGNAFGAPADIAKLPENSRPSARRATDLTLTGDRLYVWPQRGDSSPAVFDARTGEFVKDAPRPPKRVDSGAGFMFSAGRDGNFYIFAGYPAAAVARFDSAMKPFPFSDGKGAEIGGLGWPRTRLRGMCVDARGNVYVLRQKEPPPPSKGDEGPYLDANALAMFGPDGKAVNDKLVDSDLRNLNSVCVDPAGNIYMALGVHPGTEILPPNLKGKLPEGPKDPDADCGYNYYPLMYGSIVKFSPAGGEIRRKGDGERAGYGYDKSVAIRGAQWMRSGASVVPSWIHGGGFKPDICLCESPRFDVDGFGRSFFGDACAFRVGVLDTAGNLITWFGSYGNQDSSGAGSAIPTPEIPIGWVHAVAVNDEAAFVGDRLNGRVVRVKLAYAVEASCRVP